MNEIKESIFIRLGEYLIEYNFYEDKLGVIYHQIINIAGLSYKRDVLKRETIFYPK